MFLPSYALLLLATVTVSLADGLYTKSSPVLQLNHKNYDKYISNSNYTSVSGKSAICVLNSLANSCTVIYRSSSKNPAYIPLSKKKKKKKKKG